MVPINENDSGIMVDSALLSEKLYEVLRNVLDQGRMALCARHRYETLYSAERMGWDTFQVYNSLF